MERESDRRGRSWPAFRIPSSSGSIRISQHKETRRRRSIFVGSILPTSTITSSISLAPLMRGRQWRRRRHLLPPLRRPRNRTSGSAETTRLVPPIHLVLGFFLRCLGLDATDWLPSARRWSPDGEARCMACVSCSFHHITKIAMHLVSRTNRCLRRRAAQSLL